MPEPNILLIVLDAVRKDHLSCYGHERLTSLNLDDLGAEATRYENAISAAPWSAPSHASIFTGLYPTHHRVFGNQPTLQSDVPVVAEVLRSAGYTTLGFSNSFFTGKEHGFSRGFDYYHDLPSLPRPIWSGGHMFEPSIDYAQFLLRYFLTDDDISYFQAKKLKSKLQESTEPFFTFINLQSAHMPYAPPKRFRRRFEMEFDKWNEVDEETALHLASGGGVDEYLANELDVGETEWELIRHLYDAEIAYIDTLVGEIFEFLKDAGVYDETLVIVTADHGELHGEEGVIGHNFSIAEPLINVPLILKPPGGESGTISKELVSLTDLAPTFADAANTRFDTDIDGRSLLSDDEPDVVFSEYEGCYLPRRKRIQEEYGEAFERYDSRFQAARTRDHKLVKDKNGETTLYRINDLTETAVDEPEKAAELQQKLEGALGEFPGGAIGHQESEELSSHIEGHLEELGYL